MRPNISIIVSESGAKVLIIIIAVSATVLFTDETGMFIRFITSEKYSSKIPRAPLKSSDFIADITASAFMVGSPFMPARYKI